MLPTTDSKMAREFADMNRLFIVCVCSLLIRNTTVAAPMEDGDKLVLAGERIGHAQLNMDLTKLDQLFGEPTTSEQSMGGRLSETWCSKSPAGQPQQTIVDFFGIGPDPAIPDRARKFKVIKVVVTSPFFHTPAGVSTGSIASKLQKRFGFPA